MSHPIILIDARNILYRIIHSHRPHDKQHIFTRLLKFMNSWFIPYKPQSVHIFWDVPRKTIWRKKVLPTYKDRTTSSSKDISATLAKITNVCMDFFPNMNIRQYYKDTMEADDLIYAAVSLFHPRETIIISTDSDMSQIPFKFSSCKIYHPEKKKELEVPEIDPAMSKALEGDTSDVVPGYHGVGPKTSAKLLTDYKKLNEFFKTNGKDIFHRNLLLIDLALNPKIFQNKMYILKKMSQPIFIDDAILNELIKKHKINGMMSEYNNLIYPFKQLAR